MVQVVLLMDIGYCCDTHKQYFVYAIVFEYNTSTSPYMCPSSTVVPKPNLKNIY